MLQFECLKDGSWHREAGQMAVLDVDPDSIRPAISVQRSWNKSRGIIRGCKEGDILIEDHIREVLDDAGQVVDISSSGRRIFGAEKIRGQVWTVEEHLRVYQQAHPAESIVAWVGNGNLLSNPHFVAFEASPEHGTLYHLASETPDLGRDGRSYSCLVVRKPGCRPIVSIEKLFFECAGGAAQVYSADGKPITCEVEYATFGQVLVERGRAIDEEDVIRMARNEEFYDLRHIFLFGRINIGTSRWIDAGLAGFWNTAGRMDAGAVERAIRGGQISVDVRQFSSGQVREAMNAKGYVETSESVQAGEYCLQDGVLTSVLRRGIYPHSMIGIRKDGRVICVALEGLSNRVGVTICGAADIMKVLGAEDAVLIDNGGDVTMSVDNEVVLPKGAGRRSRFRSVILFRAAGTLKQLRPGDLRLVKNAGEYAGDC